MPHELKGNGKRVPWKTCPEPAITTTWGLILASKVTSLFLFLTSLDMMVNLFYDFNLYILLSVFCSTCCVLFLCYD